MKFQIPNSNQASAAKKRITGFLIICIALAAPGDEAKPDKEENSVATDAAGNIVLKLSEEKQKSIALEVATVEATEMTPEVKGYGQVMDPTPISALFAEVASSLAGYETSSNELARLKVLQGQGNASIRSLQTAEAAARHDELAMALAREHLTLAWGNAATNLSMHLAAALAARTSVLVRIDLAASETLSPPTNGARIVSLSGNLVKADFFGEAVTVDPLTQNRGFIFLVRTNDLKLLPGQAVTGYLSAAGEVLHGAVVPRAAVVRKDGAAWVYVQTDKEIFTRKEIGLEHPREKGWFVVKGVAGGEHVVVAGAQMLLSEELKSSIKPD